MNIPDPGWTSGRVIDIKILCHSISYEDWLYSRYAVQSDVKLLDRWPREPPNKQTLVIADFRIPAHFTPDTPARLPRGRSRSRDSRDSRSPYSRPRRRSYSPNLSLIIKIIDIDIDILILVLVLDLILDVMDVAVRVLAVEIVDLVLDPILDVMDVAVRVLAVELVEIVEIVLDLMADAVDVVVHGLEIAVGMTAGHDPQIIPRDTQIKSAMMIIYQLFSRMLGIVKY